MIPSLLLFLHGEDALVEGITNAGFSKDSAQTGQQQRHDIDCAGHVEESTTLFQEGHSFVFTVPDDQQDDTDDGSEQGTKQRTPALHED